MYPMLKEGAFTWSFYDEYTEATHYYAENAAGDEFEINRRLYDSLCKADGTKPLDLPDKGKGILPMLIKCDLVQTSRLIQGDGSFNRFVLFPIGNTLRKFRPLCKVLNCVLPFVSIFFFAIGIALAVFSDRQIGYTDFSLWLYSVLFVFSLALHELGHLIAGLAFGYKISDVGILLVGAFPIGGYVSYDEREGASRTEKIQMALAGIEMDLLFAGVCSLFAMTQCNQVAATLNVIAIMNLLMVGMNLLPISEFDGETALSALCGVNSIGDIIKNKFASRRNVSRYHCSTSRSHRAHRRTWSGTSESAQYLVVVSKLPKRVQR